MTSNARVREHLAFVLFARVHYMVFAPYIAIGSVAPLVVSKQLGICVSLQSDQEASWLA